jgi:hypothetical protein
VDALQPGLVGTSKQTFAFRYCDGRMVPFRMTANAARPFRGGAPAEQQPGAGGMLPPLPTRKRLETSGACVAPCEGCDVAVRPPSAAPPFRAARGIPYLAVP